MAGYNKPKKTLHREFLYLNRDSVINSLSAFEAGKVDEIIQHTSDAQAGGLEGSLSAGPARAGGSKKKQREVQEELIRTRTSFSAFDAWHKHLTSEAALGTFDDWSLDVRNELDIGDTVEFQAMISLSPLYKVFTTFLSFTASLGSADSVFKMDQKAIKDTKQTAKQMETWISGGKGRRNLLVQMIPLNQEPRIMARLSDEYIVGSPDALEGKFNVIGQVERLLTENEEESVLRIIRDVPPTPLELETISKAVAHFVEPSKALGIEIDDEDLAIRYPSVILRPIAIFR